MTPILARSAGAALRLLHSVCCAYERAVDAVPLLPWIQTVDDLAWWCGRTAERIAPTPAEIERERTFQAFMDRAAQERARQITSEHAALCACSCAPCRTGDHRNHDPVDTALCPAGQAAAERVVHEHPNGSPHLTVDPSGTVRHYCHGTGAQGEDVGTLRPGDALVLVSGPVRLSSARSSTGPAMVASDAFRAGWERINWTRKEGSKPS